MSYGGYSGYGQPAMDEKVVSQQLEDAQKVLKTQFNVQPAMDEKVVSQQLEDAQKV